MPSDLRAVDLDFLQTAPYRYVSTEVVHRPAEAIFAAIAEDPSGWGSWFPGFSHTGRYLSSAPQGVGSIREVTMAGLHYRDTILAWDSPERWAFFVDRASVPFADALAEEYVISAHGHHTVVQWTFAMDPRPAFARFMPLVEFALPRLFRRAMTNLSVRLGEPTGDRAA
jgi:Polyketide cyclase / dehydrase and lipid transport